MANPHRGEVTISLAGQSYTLRPTFHILCHIEERTGLRIPDLALRLAEKGLLASEILLIADLATRHDGSTQLDSKNLLDLPAEKVDLHALLPALAAFFAGALGRGSKVLQPDKIKCDKTKGDGLQKSALPGGENLLDWDMLLETGYGVLGLSPANFWELTMPEFRLLLRMARLNQRRRQAVADEMGQEEFEALMMQFPDRPEAA